MLMRKMFGLLIVLAVVATPALAQKITIDYAHDFDFSQVKTFTYFDTKDSNTGNDLTDSRTKNAILTQLREGGLAQIAADGDIYVTFHVTTQDNTVFNTTSYGYGGYGPGWGGYGRYGYGGYGMGYGGGMGGSTTTSSTYTDGTLILDAYEPSDKKMVWRGTGTVTLKAKPEKQANQVDKILTKMGNKWDKILKNKGK
jgi:hypothetical protein